MIRIDAWGRESGCNPRPSYSAGWDLVGVFIKLWDDGSVPRELLLELKV
jgi:hypothetical protein